MKGKKAAQTRIGTTKKNEDQVARAFNQALQATQAVRAMATLLEHERMRYVGLQEEIEAAFGGRVFLSDEPPTSVKNIRRFRTYLDMRKSATTIIVKLIDELIHVQTIDPNHPPEVLQLARHLHSRAHNVKGPFDATSAGDAFSKTSHRAKVH
jgi:hypothetical protein